MSDKRYELRRQVKSVRWMIFWVVLAQFAAETAIEAAVSFMPTPPHNYIRIAAIELIAIGVPIMVYAKTAWNGKSVKSELCLNKTQIGFFILAAILGVCGQFVMMLLNIPGNILITRILGSAATETVPVAMGWGEVLLGLLCLVAVPAVLEEFWMRGIIFRAYNRCNTKAAVLFTAIIFAFLHMRLNELAGFLFMGIVASLILIKSNSLYAAMVYHAFSNLTALLFSVYIAPGIFNYLFLVLAVAVLVFVLAFMLLVRQKNAMPIQKEFKTGGLVVNSVFSLPVILSIAVVVLKSFLLKIAG
ncbi:MAG: CPBP family intramembrane metalloprotease [Ruminococcaceae bacterium]|nr:CPBP family intramembrane metalloprotease [Oscillospiraceae bacterium]